MSVAELTDPRLAPGSYLCATGELFCVLRGAVNGMVLLENASTLEAIEVPASRVLRDGALVHPSAPSEAA